MRVLIAHDDQHEAARARSAAVRCFGGPRLTRVDIATTIGEVDDCLAGSGVTWPDVVFVATGLLERHPALARRLREHPGRGFFRTLVLSAGSDEYGRAVLSRVGDGVVSEPVTAPRLVDALRETAG